MADSWRGTYPGGAGGSHQSVSLDAHVVEGSLPVRLVHEAIEAEARVDFSDAKVFNAEAVVARILNHKVWSPSSATLGVLWQGAARYLLFEPLPNEAFDVLASCSDYVCDDPCSPVRGLLPC